MRWWTGGASFTLRSRVKAFIASSAAVTSNSSDGMASTSVCGKRGRLQEHPVLFQILLRELRHEVRVPVLVDPCAGLDSGLVHGPQNTLLVPVREVIVERRLSCCPC